MKLIEHLLNRIQGTFPTFGFVGKEHRVKRLADNPLVDALQEKPLMFAMGVDVNMVIHLILQESGHTDLLGACKAWMKVESEMGDKHPCPDYTLRQIYRKEAAKLTKQAIASAKTL